MGKSLSILLLSSTTAWLMAAARPDGRSETGWHPADPFPPSAFNTRHLKPAHPFSYSPPGVTRRNPNRVFQSAQNVSCGVENPPPGPVGRVVGGSEAADGQFPWLAFVRCFQPYNWACSGSFVHQDWVLTAAHCVLGCRAFYVVAGAHDVSRLGTAGDDSVQVLVYQEADEFANPEFDHDAHVNDLGLIRLPTPAPLERDDVGLSCLPSRAMAGQDLVGERATISGWGLTSYSGDDLDVPHFARDRAVVSTGECGDIYGLPIAEADTICTSVGGEHVGICSGDSGGPLSLQPAEGNYSSFVQVGVASFGFFLCAGGPPDGFARIDSHLDWIEETTGMAIG